MRALASTVCFAAVVLALHALPTHAEGTISPPVNRTLPKLCVRHQTFVNAHGKTVTGCEPIALFETEGKTLHP